ncbi:hypothetical protein POUND7_000100 [Theobroma cacao]
MSLSKVVVRKSAPETRVSLSL